VAGKYGSGWWEMGALATNEPRREEETAVGRWGMGKCQGYG
jgi:hypothetical protein